MPLPPSYSLSSDQYNCDSLSFPLTVQLSAAKLPRVLETGGGLTLTSFSNIDKLELLGPTAPRSSSCIGLGALWDPCIVGVNYYGKFGHNFFSDKMLRMP